MTPRRLDQAGLDGGFKSSRVIKKGKNPLKSKFPTFAVKIHTPIREGSGTLECNCTGGERSGVLSSSIKLNLGEECDLVCRTKNKKTRYSWVVTIKVIIKENQSSNKYQIDIVKSSSTST